MLSVKEAVIMGSNCHVLFAQRWDKIPVAEIKTDPSLLVLILDKWQKSFYPSNLFPWLKGYYFLAFIVFIQRDRSGFSRGRWSLSTNAEGWGSWTLGLLYHHLTICPVNTCQVRCGTSGSKKTAYNNSLSLSFSLYSIPAWHRLVLSPWSAGGKGAFLYCSI